MLCLDEKQTLMPCASEQRHKAFCGNTKERNQNNVVVHVYGLVYLKLIGADPYQFMNNETCLGTVAKRSHLKSVLISASYTEECIKALFKIISQFIKLLSLWSKIWDLVFLVLQTITKKI